MNWTEDDARRFVEKVRQAKANQSAEDKPVDPLTKERESFGQGTGLKTRSGRRAGSTPQRYQAGFIQGQHVAPPPEYRDRYDAFNKSLSSEAGTTKPASQPGAASDATSPPAPGANAGKRSADKEVKLSSF